MFGKHLTELPPIKEAVATYMIRASEKFRAQDSAGKKIRVSIRTGMFNPEEANFANGVVVDLPYPTVSGLVQRHPLFPSPISSTCFSMINVLHSRYIAVIEEQE